MGWVGGYLADDVSHPEEEDHAAHDGQDAWHKHARERAQPFFAQRQLVAATLLQQGRALRVGPDLDIGLLLAACASSQAAQRPEAIQ